MKNRLKHLARLLVPLFVGGTASCEGLCRTIAEGSNPKEKGWRRAPEPSKDGS